MAKNKNVVHIRLKSSESPHVYHKKKNKKNHPNRMEIKKFDPVVNKHVLYKEEK